jgi:molybdopterin synthase sulfur carrier subunit
MVMPMVNVSAKILLFATLRDKYGVRELEVKCDGTVRNLIENAAKTLNKGFLARIYDVNRNKVREDLIFTINGRNIKDIKGEIEIREGDKVAIFPPLAGG